MFKNYHYLSYDLNPSAQVYIAKLWGEVIGFVAVLHFPHPIAKNLKKISRIVVLPDYQGIGIGKMLMNYVGEFYTNKGYRMRITTSHPAINRSMRLHWKLIRKGRVPSVGKKTQIKDMMRTITNHRNTCTWEYVK